MKIVDNTAVAIKKYFVDQLVDTYEKREIGRFFERSIEHYTGLRAHDLIIAPNHRFSESELLKLMAVVKGLKKEIPIQYLLGVAHFYELELLVNKAVLIPRPETEELVDWVLKTVAVNLKELKILDVGTGSGCIPLALKANLPNAQLLGIDVSEAALEVARHNAAKLKLDVDFQLTDILNPAVEIGNNFQVIVSNPPYVMMSEKTQMKKNVIDHEPHTALFVPDSDPLVFYHRIADLALQLLCKSGWLFFEINESLGEPLKKLLAKKGFHSIELRKDLSGKDRMIKCCI